MNVTFDVYKKLADLSPEKGKDILITPQNVNFYVTYIVVENTDRFGNHVLRHDDFYRTKKFMFAQINL